MARIKPGKNTTRKELITRKAATLFKSKGYAVASMRDLAESIGVEAPSLYNHIGSKSEILRSICFTVAGSFTSHLEQTLQGTDPILHKVAAIIRFHIGMMLNDFDLNHYLFGTTTDNLTGNDIKRITNRLDKEMHEIFYGRNMPDMWDS